MSATSRSRVLRSRTHMIRAYTTRVTMMSGADAARAHNASVKSTAEPSTHPKRCRTDGIARQASAPMRYETVAEFREVGSPGEDDHRAGEDHDHGDRSGDPSVETAQEQVRGHECDQRQHVSEDEEPRDGAEQQIGQARRHDEAHASALAEAIRRRQDRRVPHEDVARVDDEGGVHRRVVQVRRRHQRDAQPEDCSERRDEDGDAFEGRSDQPRRSGADGCDLRLLGRIGRRVDVSAWQGVSGSTVVRCVFWWARMRSVSAAHPVCAGLALTRATTRRARSTPPRCRA